MKNRDNINQMEAGTMSKYKRTCRNCGEADECVYYHNYPKEAKREADECEGFYLDDIEYLYAFGVEA